MEETSLLSLPEGMRVEHIQITEEGLVISTRQNNFPELDSLLASLPRS